MIPELDDPSMTGAKAWEIIKRLLDEVPRRTVEGTNYARANSDVLYDAIEYVRLNYSSAVFQELDDLLWGNGYHRHQGRPKCRLTRSTPLLSSSARS